MPAATFLAGVTLLAAHDGVEQTIHTPVAKSLLLDYKRLVGICSRTPFLESLFLEVAERKVGIKMEAVVREPIPDEIIARKLLKVIGSRITTTREGAIPALQKHVANLDKAAAEKAPPTADKEEEQEVIIPSDGKFALGQEVVTSAGKQKDKFNEKRGRITKIGASKARVCMQEGPAKGEEKDFMYAKLRPCESRKRPATTSPEDLASKLFGDVDKLL